MFEIFHYFAFADTLVGTLLMLLNTSLDVTSPSRNFFLTVPSPHQPTPTRRVQPTPPPPHTRHQQQQPLSHKTEKQTENFDPFKSVFEIYFCSLKSDILKSVLQQ